TTAEVSGTINQQLVSKLPSNGGNFLDLASLVPGTTSEGAMGPWTGAHDQVSQGESALMRGGATAAGLSVTSGIFLGGRWEGRFSKTSFSFSPTTMRLSFLSQNPAGISQDRRYPSTAASRLATKATV
ncbi:MAG TPA: hypothetical protein VFE27_08915, partial [Acidobacteriaceae bacterium]|nr:hypothetical protein [Acidobacteriaceae bacterium]